MTAKRGLLRVRWQSSKVHSVFLSPEAPNFVKLEKYKVFWNQYEQKYWEIIKSFNKQNEFQSIQWIDSALLVCIILWSQVLVKNNSQQ